MELLKYKRGDVYWVNLDPTVGTEVKKNRPAVIVSNDKANRILDHLQVVPLTSNISKLYPGECYLTVKRDKARVMCDQIRTVSKKRLSKKITEVTSAEMAIVDLTLKRQLGL